MAALVALENFASRKPSPEMSAGQGTGSAVGLTGFARSYPEAIARLDATIADGRARVAAGPDQWLLHEILARNYLAKARLSGSFDDFAAARSALARAFELAPPGSGPHLSQAALDFGMHRLNDSERQLALIDAYAIPPDPVERAEIAAMRGDLAFYRGDYPSAMRAFERADALAPGAATFRRAIYAARMGAPAEAEHFFDRSERELQSPTAQVRAYHELQRGILDLERGRLDDALAHFRRADRVFPGHWLIEEHIAEVATLQGRLDEAEAMYRDIVRRTGHPEFMDALAGIAAERGDAAARDAWSRRAAAVWRQRLAQFPEAAYGHAIDHCLDKGDRACALSLAERNHRARPYGDAKVKLAQALLLNGRLDEARRMIDTALASPWRTADLHKVASDIYAAIGERAEAARQLAAARSINPLV
jgi:tetratricopeptide (TPR) repeat protein